MMVKTVVSDSALRELLREALDNIGAMAADAAPPVSPNAVVDRASMELDLDPIEVKTLPHNKQELIIMVRNLLDTVDDDQSGELYTRIKQLVGGSDTGEKDFARAKRVVSSTSIANGTMGMKKMGESKLVNAVKEIVEGVLSEALPFGFGKGKMGLGGQWNRKEDEEEGPHDDFLARGGSSDDEFKPGGSINFDPNEDISDSEELEALLAQQTASAWDPDGDGDDDSDDGSDDDDGDEEGLEAAPPLEKARKSPNKRVDAGTGYGVDGDTFAKIAQTMDYTPEAAKKAVATAMERFKVLHSMDPDDLESMVLAGTEKYIDALAKTGELTDDDVAFMRQHPEHVAASDSFREFFSTFVKRAVREERADTQDDEE